MSGFFVLSVSGILCKIIGAFFRLPLTYILGVDGIGVFQLVMSVFSFVLVLASGGISITLSKLISSARAKREYGKIKWYIYLAVTYSVIASFLIGLLFLVMAKPLSTFQHTPDAWAAYMFFLPLLIFSSLVAFFRGIYQGYENMLPTAISQIVEQISKFVFGLLFAFLLSKHSMEGGVLGAFLGILAGEVLAFIYLILQYKSINLRQIKVLNEGRKNFYLYLFPATIGLAISSFIHFFDSVVIVNRLSKAGFAAKSAASLYGLQSGIVGALLNFPLIISMSFATTILPKLSFNNSSSKKDKESIKNSFAYLWYILLPITFGIVAISYPLYKFAYPFLDDILLNCAVKLTALGAVSTIFFAVMQFLISVLQSKGEFKYVTISQTIAGLLKVLCTIFLCSAPTINIYGVVIGNIVYAFGVAISCLIKLKGVGFINLDNFFAPLLSSLVMLVVVSLLSISLKVSLLLNLVSCVVCGTVIFLILTLPIIKGFKKDFVGKKTNKEK